MISLMLAALITTGRIMTWHRIRFTKANIKEGSPEAFKREFKRFWYRVGKPKDMALFLGNPYEGKKEQVFYLSPECLPWAQSIISYYYASPCDKPPKTEVTPKLLIGHPEAIELVK